MLQPETFNPEAKGQIMISILMLSWHRYDMLKATLPNNLRECREPYELLVCDQGSEAPVVSFLEAQKPAYFRKNKINEGIGKSFNQLFLRAEGDYIALMSNDIMWPANWGTIYRQWLDKVPKPGICGAEWAAWMTPPLTEKFGFKANWCNEKLNRVYGPLMFKREVVDAVGLFPESFDRYGEDYDFNERVNRAGFSSFYIPGLKANHMGDDSYAPDIRKMKDACNASNFGLFEQRVKSWDAGGSFKEPLPPLRDPL
jgi:GT2 family glycosyltransferase